VLLIISVDLLYEALDHGVRDEHMLCPMIPDYVNLSRAFAASPSVRRSMTSL
jgi:hypothetical protein